MAKRKSTPKLTPDALDHALVALAAEVDECAEALRLAEITASSNGCPESQEQLARIVRLVTRDLARITESTNSLNAAVQS